MRKSPTVSTAVVKNDFELVVQMGVSPEKLEEAIGLERSRLDYSDERLPIWPAFQLYESIYTMVDDPAFALKIGEHTDPRSLGIFGNIILNCRNLGEMLDSLCRYYSIARELTRVHSRINKDRMWIVFEVEAPDNIRHFLVEKFFATILSFIQRLTSFSIQPLEIGFSHSEVEYLDEYRRIFRCPLLFNHFENSVSFDIKYLDYKCNRYNPRIKEILSHHADMLIPNHFNAPTFREQVEELIIKNLHQGQIDIEMVSDRLQMSRWTLNRKLSTEDTSFQQILVDIRKKLALDYLKNSRFSVQHVAYLLGFSNQSYFPKAFKRWHGMTPLEYRNLKM